MINAGKFVVLTLDERRYALSLSAVKRIVRLVEISPLPKAPGIILGVINFEGRIIPVVNLRERFRLPERQARLSDQLIIASTAQQMVAMVADAVTEVIERTQEEVTRAEQIFHGLEYVEGAIKMEDGIVLIHDLRTFLSVEEERTLDEALRLTA